MSRNKVTIVTHNSNFHVDDVFAVGTLLVLLEKDNEVEIIRSRDPEVIKEGDYVVDVGFIYDPLTNRFDHHQEVGSGSRENNIPYSAFGLVWKKFGEQLCGNKEAAERIDQFFVQPIDAADNGIDLSVAKIPGVNPLDIRTLLHMFRPTWREGKLNIDERFKELAYYAKFLVERVIVFQNDEIEGERLVEEAYQKAKDKRVIWVEEGYPWVRILGKFPEPLYVVYKRNSGNAWSIKCVRDSVYSYKLRKPLPQEWAGKKGEELEKIVGVRGADFCHKVPFLAGATTEEAILKMADLALNS